MDEELITLRVQYLVDTDPFSSLSIYPIPSRAPVYSFVVSAPLATQLGALLRWVLAPQRVRTFKLLFLFQDTEIFLEGIELFILKLY